MRSKWISRLAWICFGCLLAFLVLEGFTRLAFPVAKESDKFWQADPVLGWTNIPNKQGFYRSSEFADVPVAINSKGLRDNEYTYDKPEGAYRILVLGDSFVQALQVPAQQSFCKLLEAQLNELSGSNRHFDVINAGTMGYGTDQELLFWKQEGFKYHPDLVILTFCTINDVMDNSPQLEVQDLGERKQFFVLKDGKLVLQPMTFLPQGSSQGAAGLRDALRTIARQSRLYQIVRRVWTARTQGMTRVETQTTGAQTPTGQAGALRSMPIHYGVYAPQYTPEWEQAWDVTRAILLQLRDETQAAGARFMVMSATTGEELYDEWRHMLPEGWDLDKPNRILADLLPQNGIPFLSLLPFFRQDYQQTGRYLHFRVDGHWTSEGHALAAQTLYDYLAQQGAAAFGGQSAAVLRGQGAAAVGGQDWLR
jgi:hypothetical protein